MLGQSAMLSVESWDRSSQPTTDPITACRPDTHVGTKTTIGCDTGNRDCGVWGLSGRPTGRSKRVETPTLLGDYVRGRRRTINPFPRATLEYDDEQIRTEAPDRTMNLDGQTCLVTGSSRGIGRGIAEDLAAHGATVVVNYRSSAAEAAAVVESIEDDGGSAVTAQGDVSSFDDVEAMRAEIHDAVGPIDVLVNNAGITVDKKFENMTREDWESVIDVNLGGVYNCTKVFYDDIQAADHGRLINISSVVGQQGNYGQANYATTKSGMFGFTRTIALELASTGSTANCIAPGFVKTDMLEEVPERVQEKILRDIPLNRFATVEDISSIVTFVASESASYMTGQVLGVNGGMEW